VEVVVVEVAVVEVAVGEVVEAVSGGIGTTSSGSWYWHCSSVGGSLNLTNIILFSYYFHNIHVVSILEVNGSCKNNC
jgi:hypothetical protein